MFSKTRHKTLRCKIDPGKSGYEILHLKVPECEIFDPFFFTSINPIWVGDLRTGEKKKNF